MKRIFSILTTLVLASLYLSANTPDSLYIKYEAARGGDRKLRAAEMLSELQDLDLVDSLTVSEVLRSEAVDAWIKYLYADWLYGEGRVTEAYECAGEALPLCEKAGDGNLLSDCMSLLSVCCQRGGRFDEALTYLKRCYELDSESGDNERLSSTLNSLAGLYMSIGQPSEARGYILKAIALERRLEDSKALAIRLGMASEIYQKLDEPDSALTFVREAYTLDKEAGRETKAAVRLSQMADVYRALGNGAMAVECLNEAIPVLREKGATMSLAISLNSLGDLDCDAGRLSDASNNYWQALRCTEGRSLDYIRSHSLSGLWRCSRERDPKAALKWLEEYSALKDSMFRENTEKAVADFKVKYETAEREKQIIQYKSDLEKRQRNILTLSLALVLTALLLALTLLLQISYRKRMKLLESNSEVKDHLLSVIPRIEEKNEQSKLKAIASEIAVRSASSSTGLTAREREIIVYCCRGLSTKEIAGVLNISVRTVDAHKSNIFRKLKINNIAELVRYGMENNLFS